MFRSLSRSLLPEVDTAASIDEIQRLQEKQKLLNMSMDYNSYSPISLSSTHPHRYGAPEMYDDPWGIHRHVNKQEPYEIPMMMKQHTYGIKQETSYDNLPMIHPFLNKSNSIPINPFHTDVAPSAMLFPYEAQQQEQQQQHDLFTDTSPISFIDSDDDMEQTSKRQRGEHHTIYIKQEQMEDQDIGMVITTTTTTSYPQQPMLLSQPSSNQYIDYTATAVTSLDQLYNNTTVTTTPFTLTPITIPSQHQMSIPSSSSSSTSSRRGSIDSYPSDDGKQQQQQRKRKSSASSTLTSQRKSQPIGTHAIENTGAPVKMAKYLHVDALSTQVWIEHATYEEKGITTDVRMIMYSGAFNGVVVHAGDVGERIVCNRRSNISREFGQYSSTVELTEKILIRIPSEHRPLGQTGNVLTGYGLIRFLQSKKMRKPENQAYRRWLLQHVYGILQALPFTFPQGHPLETRTTPITPFTEADFSY